jgi:hypothetical protein
MPARLDRALETLTFGAVPSFDLATQFGAFDLKRVGGELRADHLHPQPPATPAQSAQVDPEPVPNSLVVGEHGRDGVDYSRICFVHKWASRTVVASALATRQTCPYCDADADGGRERYRELVDRLVLVGR